MAIWLMMFALGVAASPVFRVTKSVRQSDGKELTITRTGADHILYYVTQDGLPVFPNQKGDYCYAEFDTEGNVAAGMMLAHEPEERTPAEQAVTKQMGEAFFTHMNLTRKNRYGVGSLELASVVSMGDVRLPVVLAEFADVAFQQGNDLERFDKHFNAENYTDEGGSGSVRDYFIAQSYGKFRPHFDVLAKVKVSKPRANYGGNSGGNDKNPTGYIAEAVDSAIARGIDFTPYKNSKGEIMITVIYPGHGEQVSGNDEELWAAYYFGMSHTNKQTGLKFTSGFVMDELADYGLGEQFDGIGTFCHEFSHALGLPDFYNTNGVSGIFGMDAWSLMDYGQFNNFSRTPVGYTAYEREFFGWLKIDTLVNQKQLVSLPPLHSDSAHVAYRILNESDPSGNEYYVLENREESDWFMPIYGEGMMIMHVDYLRSAWTGKSINNNATHQRMTIIPADGVLTPISNKSSTYKGDLWPGYTNNTELNSTTTPCDTAYVGGYMNIRMSNILRDVNNNIVFFYQCSGQLAMVKEPKVDAVSKDALALNWAEVANAESYVVTLCHAGDTLRLDSISADENELALSYEGLMPATEYEVTVKAVAADYLDSEPIVLTLKTMGDIASGDVNHDGLVNSADVVAIYNYIANGEQADILLEDADINGDNAVDSADIVAVYDIITKGSL